MVRIVAVVSGTVLVSGIFLFVCALCFCSPEFAPTIALPGVFALIAGFMGLEAAFSD